MTTLIIYNRLGCSSTRVSSLSCFSAVNIFVDLLLRDSRKINTSTNLLLLWIGKPRVHHLYDIHRSYYYSIFDKRRITRIGSLLQMRNANSLIQALIIRCVCLIFHWLLQQRWVVNLAMPHDYRPHINEMSLKHNEYFTSEIEKRMIIKAWK